MTLNKLNSLVSYTRNILIHLIPLS